MQGEIKTFSDFDKQMLEKGRRRRRMMDVSDEETDVWIRNYNVSSLDGLWYDFTVNFELCFDDNDALKAAVESFEDIIDSQPSGELWTQYTANTSQNILQISLDAYYGWSNGFGDVEVQTLNMLYANYADEETEIDSNHPQRRKARFWNYNLEERDEDYIWIDETIDCE